MRRILDFECKSNLRHFVVGEDELEYPLREKAMSEIVHVLALVYAQNYFSLL